MNRFSAKPTTVKAVRIINAVINPPVEFFIPPASIAAKGAGMSIRFNILKLSGKFFGP